VSRQGKRKPKTQNPNPDHGRDAQVTAPYLAEYRHPKLKTQNAKLKTSTLPAQKLGRELKCFVQQRTAALVGT
jgi:hypothetical protein